MENNRALSPEVKSLFDAVKGQVKDYNNSFEILTREMKNLERQRVTVVDAMTLLTQRVEDKIQNLQEIHDSAIKELDETTEKAENLRGELLEVQRVRIQLQEQSESISKYILELQGAINEFRYKSDKELAQTIAMIEQKVEDELEKESQKIEVRLSMKVKQLETKVQTNEQRLMHLNENTKKDFRMMANEVEGVKSDTSRLSQISDELNNAILLQNDDLETSFSQKYKQLERHILTVIDKVEEIESNGGGGKAKDDDFDDWGESDIGSVGSIADKLKGLGGGGSGASKSLASSGDNSALAKDVKSIAQKLDKLMTESETIVEKATFTEKKGNLALYIAGASLVGMIILFIIILSK